MMELHPNGHRGPKTSKLFSFYEGHIRLNRALSKRYHSLKRVIAFLDPPYLIYLGFNDGVDSILGYSGYSFSILLKPESYLDINASDLNFFSLYLKVQ